MPPIVTSMVNSAVHIDNTGSALAVPILLTAEGCVEAALSYCLAYFHSRSVVWARKVLGAIQRLIDYVSANPEQTDGYLLFLHFSQRLYTGTFDKRTGIDPSGLCWRPMDSREAGNIIARLTAFFDWLEATSATPTVNPRFRGNRFDRMIDEAAYQYRRNRSLLGHTWATIAPQDATGRLIRPAREPGVVSPEPPAFPDACFMELLLGGFCVRGHYDYRNMLILLLIHGAGLRPSEPMHLFVDDVVPDPRDPSRALVLVHHPSAGAAPASWIRELPARRGANRKTYLQEQWGLSPRQEYLTSERAGWKGGAHERVLNGLAYRCYWFPPQFGQLFLKIWYRYMEQIAQVDREHPWCFINLRRGVVGAPYKLSEFSAARARAIERIGLSVSKEAGTSDHGHRHAYGKRLKRAGLSEVEIQRAMHHRSIESQQVYTQPGSAELLSALDAGVSRLQAALDVAVGDRLSRLVNEF